MRNAADGRFLARAPRKRGTTCNRGGPRRPRPPAQKSSPLRVTRTHLLPTGKSGASGGRFWGAGERAMEENEGRKVRASEKRIFVFRRSDQVLLLQKHRFFFTAPAAPPSAGGARSGSASGSATRRRPAGWLVERGRDGGVGRSAQNFVFPPPIQKQKTRRTQHQGQGQDQENDGRETHRVAAGEASRGVWV